MNKLGSSSAQSSAADDETATFQNWVAAPPPVDVVAVESAHERLLNQYLAAWSEAVLIESWKPDQAHPRNEYLGPIARVLGTVLGLFMSIRSIVDSGIASDKQEGAAHVRSFVQR